MPDGQVTDIAVLTSRLDQVYKDIGSIQSNVEKLANGQETRMRELERYQATTEERWENHWKGHIAADHVTDKAWSDHAIAHDELKTKQRLADVIGSGTALIAAAIAAVFGINK